MSFRERAQTMGFTEITEHSYFYQDRFSKVVYKELQPKDLEGEVPSLAIFTAKNEGQYDFAGMVSELYNFVGNENVVAAITERINATGSAIFNEIIAMNDPKFTSLCMDIVIQNQNNIPEVGDVYPIVNIANSYDGTKAAGISFGLALYENDRASVHSISFRNTLGTYRQVHTVYSSTSLSYAIGNYINSVHQNISELVSENMNNQIDDTTLLSTLDLVEKIGKKKRTEISEYLKVLTNQARPITSWDLFLAITKFSTIEKNLNARVLLENIVEKMMIIPTQMIQALPRLNQQAA